VWAPRADPIDRAVALEGIRALNALLPQVFDAPSDVEGHENALYGAYLAAVDGALLTDLLRNAWSGRDPR
jgi:maleylacetate reductase